MIQALVSSESAAVRCSALCLYSRPISMPFWICLLYQGHKMKSEETFSTILYMCHCFSVLHRCPKARGLFILKISKCPYQPCSVMWWTAVVLSWNKKWSVVVSDLTVSPKGFDESFHFLCFSLNADMSLELSQGFVEFHAWEIHLVHNTAIKRQTERETKIKKKQEREKWERDGV